MGLINKKFREYERKIQRLGQLKREFDSLNTEGLESEANAIKSKLRDPTKIDEIETDIASLKTKIKERERKEQKRKEAQDAVNILNSVIKEAEKLGITITRSNELASSAFDRAEYDNATNYANKGKEEIENRINRYKNALNQMNKSKSAVDNIRRFDLSFNTPDELIKKAESELKTGNYDSAVKIAKEAEVGAVRIKKDYEASKEASALISSVESEITKIKSSGVKIPKSEESIELAKSGRVPLLST